MEDRLVEREIGHEAFELAILVPQLPQFAELGDAQRAEALLPSVERLLADAELAADLADGRTGFRLAQGQGDLLVRKLAFSSGPPAPPHGARCGPQPSSKRGIGWTRKRGGTPCPKTVRERAPKRSQSAQPGLARRADISRTRCVSLSAEFPLITPRFRRDMDRRIMLVFTSRGPVTA